MIDAAKLGDAELKKLGATRKELEEAVALLQKKKERVAKIERGEIKGTSYKKRSEMTKEELAKVKELDKKYLARTKLLIEKAKKAGITVTDKEVEAYLKKEE